MPFFNARPQPAAFQGGTGLGASLFLSLPQTTSLPTLHGGSVLTSPPPPRAYHSAFQLLRPETIWTLCSHQLLTLTSYAQLKLLY